MEEIEVQPFKTTEFIAIVTNSDGCTDKATTKVKVEQPLSGPLKCVQPLRQKRHQ